ncbi:MAG TPA: hypothetical protein VF609_06845, partial [Flavisolibacter sp.]
MKSFWNAFTIFAFCHLALTLKAQNFSTALSNFNIRNPQEKIYLHYDKDYYIAGETVWFKAYLFHNGMPSTLSHNFYLEMQDANGNVIASKKYPVAGASVKGSIDLPDSLPQAAYVVRAYTAAAADFQLPELLYKKTLFVFNSSEKHIKTATIYGKAVTLQFFPESGNFVDGITNVVAFKATDPLGRPVSVKGVVNSNDGVTFPFNSYHDGIGKLSLRPVAGKKYTATIEGNAITYSLPEVQPAGITLNVQDEKGGKLFTVNRSKNNKGSFQKIILVAQINNLVVYENEINFEDYLSVKGHLLTDSLPSGILHFTAFNEDRMPLAERLAFIDNKEYMVNGSFVSTKEGVGKRQENEIEIRFTDNMQKSLSVSVTDLSGIIPNEKETIGSYFLLTSNLKGHVYNPSWYSKHTNDSVKIALDNLLLTHGWSRFNWKKILVGELAAKQSEDVYLLSVSGSVKDEKGLAVKGGRLNVYVEDKDSATKNYDIPVSDNGRFILDSLLFYGRTRIFYNYFLKGENKPVSLNLDSAVTDVAVQFLPVLLPPCFDGSLSSSGTVEKLALQKPKETKQLETVTLQAKSNKRPIDIVNEKYTSALFRPMGKLTLDNVNYPANNRSMSVVDYISNSIRQVELKGDRFVSTKNQSVTMLASISNVVSYDPYGKPVREQKANQPATKNTVAPADPGNASGEKWAVDVLLNEMPITVASLKAIRMDEVALIKYYDAGFIGSGTNGSGGTVAIYTKQQNDAPTKDIMLNHTYYHGYSITKEFYSPDYAVPDP